MRCDRCGADNAAEEAFCGSCGAPRPDPDARVDEYLPGFSPPPPGTPGVRSTMGSANGEPSATPNPPADPGSPTPPPAAPPPHGPGFVDAPPAGGAAPVGVPTFVPVAAEPTPGQEALNPPNGGYAAGQAPSAPGQSTSHTALIVVAAVLVLVVVAGAFVVFRSDGGSDTTTASGPRGAALMGESPGDEPEEQWSESAACYDSCYVAATSDGVFAYDTDDEEVELRGFARSDGSELWSAQLEDGVSPDVLLTRGDTVVASTYAYDEADESESSEIVAFAADDGEERWSESFEVASLLDLDVPGAVVISEFSSDAETIVLDLEDGGQRWSERGTTLNVCDGMFVLSSEGEVSLVDGESGDVRWSVDVDEEGGISSAGCSGDGIVIVDEDQLIALSKGDGDEIWSERLPGDYGYVVGAKDGQIAVAMEDDLVAFSAKDGSETWSERMPGDVAEQASTVYVTDEGFLVALGGEEAVIYDAGSGDEKASARLGDAYQFELAENAFLVADDEEITAYDPSSLDERWSYRVDELATFVTDGGSLFTLSSEEVSAAR